MPICQRRTLSLKGFAVGSIEYSICNFKQFAYFRFAIYKYTIYPSSDNASLSVWRWPNRVFPMEFLTVSIYSIDNLQICSLAIAQECLWQGLPLSRSGILSASLGRLVTSESHSIHMLTCDRPKLSPTVFAVGSIGYSLCIFRQVACFRLTIHKYTYLTSPDSVYDIVYRSLDRVFYLQLQPVSLLPFTNHKYTHLLSPDTDFDKVCR